MSQGSAISLTRCSRGSCRSGEKRAVAGQRGCEVEAEAVDVHDADPVAQRIHDHLQNARMGEIQGVAAAAEILVAVEMVGPAGGSSSVVDAAKRQVGPASSDSAVWLKTTSRMTSRPAACSERTMVLNSAITDCPPIRAA
jgi:hypothetical protein